MITAQLLDGLLSPTHRQQAEFHLESMSVVDRAQGLLAILPQLHLHLHLEGQILLAAVLLRRQVTLLGEQVILNQLKVRQVSSLLRGMVDPLLVLFVGRSTARRQVGHVLAELCSTMSLLSEPDSHLVLNQILEQIAPAVSTFYFPNTNISSYVWIHLFLFSRMTLDFCSACRQMSLRFASWPASRIVPLQLCSQTGLCKNYHLCWRHRSPHFQRYLKWQH